MRIAIIDDSMEMLETILKTVKGCAEGINSECDLYQKPQAVLGKLEDRRTYDLYLMDIEMPQMNGFELAKKIRMLQKEAYIVFLTSYAEYALESYDLSIKAYNYILKEDLYEKIPVLLKELSDEIEDRKNDYYIIENNCRYEKIRIKDIIYIYKQEKNSIFVTEKEEYKERKALSKVIKSIGKPEFIQVDSGRIVNIDYIRKIEHDTIFLIGGMEIYAGHSNIKRLKTEISRFWRDML